MATNNYLKIIRPSRRSVEFFFDSHVPISVANALRAAIEFATATEVEGELPPLSVWQHGVRGLGDLHCVGGCELCAPRPDLEIVEAEDDLDEPPSHGLL